jgi:hypothetical protein
MGGVGAYFWADGYKFEELAEAWYKQRLRWGNYIGDDDRRGIILIVELKCPRENYIDLHEPRFSKKVGQLADERKPKVKLNNKQRGELYDYVLSEFEEVNGVKFSITSFRVFPPKDTDYFEYDVELVGVPLCYIARDNSVINILKEKEV